MSRNSIITQIQNDDPSYDPLAAALGTSGISPSQFDAAYDRVVFDGNFGPIQPAEWREQDGREPATVDEALKLLGKVSEQIDDYHQTSEVYCASSDDLCDLEYRTCPGHSVTETVVSAEDIRRDVFAAVIDIYGHLPF